MIVSKSKKLESKITPTLIKRTIIALVFTIYDYTKANFSNVSDFSALEKLHIETIKVRMTFYQPTHYSYFCIIIFYVKGGMKLTATKKEV